MKMVMKHCGLLCSWENSNKLNEVTIFSGGELVLHGGNNCNNFVGCSKGKI